MGYLKKNPNLQQSFQYFFVVASKPASTYVFSLPTFHFNIIYYWLFGYSIGRRQSMF